MKTQTRILYTFAALALALGACSAPVPIQAPIEAPAPPKVEPVVKLPEPTAAAVVVQPTAVPATVKPVEPGPLIRPDQTLFQDQVDIGGRSLYLVCMGKGEPTIVYDAGLVTSGARIMSVGADLPSTTRLCYYDRPNVDGGNTAPMPGIRTSQDVVTDLDKLLKAAGVKPPYVLVGHSFGGMNMTLFAAQHPKDVAGLVLLDPLAPGTFETWQQMLKAGPFEGDRNAMQSTLDDLLRGDMGGASEGIDIPASTAQVSAVQNLGSLPVVLFAAARPLDGWAGSSDPAFAAKMDQTWKDLQGFYAKIAPNARVIPVDDNHILYRSGAPIQAEILNLIDPVRKGGGPLTLAPTAYQKMDMALTGFNQRGQFNGAVLVTKDGQVLLNRAYGSPETGTLGPETLLRIGALTKLYTAVAVMKLKEDGKLSLQDSICKYVSACPTRWKPITVANLLADASGLPDYGQLVEPTRTKVYTAATLIDALKKAPTGMYREIGAGTPWTPTDYMLLGQVIEKASGMPYARYVQQTILDPLNLTHTVYDDGSGALKGAAPLFEYTDDKPIPHVAPNASYLQSFGAMYSTAQDFMAFFDALMAGKLISAESVREMMKQQAVYALAADWRLQPGYGVMVGKDTANRPSIAVLGWDVMPTTLFTYYPSDKLAIALMSNVDDHRPGHAEPLNQTISLSELLATRALAK